MGHEVRQLWYSALEAELDWREKHWGCKYAYNTTLRSESPRCLKYTFGTPWAPPYTLLKNIAPNWPSLTFHGCFSEETGWFGEFLIKGSQERSRDAVHSCQAEGDPPDDCRFAPEEVEEFSQGIL